MHKPLSDMAGYIKNLIPADIPEVYPLKPMLKSISSEDSIRRGVLAFRDFLCLVCDRLIADGSKYERPSNKATDDDSHHISLPVCYPFINNVKSVLINIGDHGELTEDGMLLVNRQSLTSPIAMNGKPFTGKISAPKVIECLRFLTGCGIHIDGIDLNAGKSDMSTLLEISYSGNPIMLTGLKVMAIAQRELYTKGNNDIFLRCDYRVLKDEKPDVTSYLNDIIRLLTAKARDFTMKLHQRYLDAGLICKMDVSFLNIRFIYFYNNKEIGTFSVSFDSGYRIIIKAKNTYQYSELIETFPIPLQEKIARGYGCEKKRFGERCQKGCHGFSFSLDDSIFDISRNIEILLDKELSYLHK